MEPVTATIERNEVILRAGDIVSSLDIEALEALGLRQSAWSWDEWRGTGAFALLLGLVFLYYLWRQEPQLWLQRTEPFILAAGVAALPAGRQGDDPGPHAAALSLPLRRAR